MSTDRNTPSQSSIAMPNASVRHVLEPALADLGHLVGAHLLLGHPVQRLRRRPVAAQADLQESVAAHGAGLDQPAHRLAVARQRAELDVPGVRVRVEMDHRDPAVAGCWATPVASGQAIVWSPPRTSGMAPVRVTS